MVILPSAITANPFVCFYRSVSYNFSGCVLKDSVFRQENKPKDTLIAPWFLCHRISANSCWVWNRPAGAVCFWEVMWFTPIARTWRLPGGKKKSGEVWARWPEACDSGLLGSQASQFWLPGAGLLEGSCSPSKYPQGITRWPFIQLCPQKNSDPRGSLR